MSEENFRIIGIPPAIRRLYVDVKLSDHKPAKPEGFNPSGPLSKGIGSEDWSAVVRRFLVRKGLVRPGR